MKVLIINNLSSGNHGGGLYDFIRSFVRDGDDITIRSTDSTTPIESLLYDATEFDLVVPSGGDGTLTSVLYSLCGTGVRVLPHPAGTANLLALNLKEPSEAHALAKLAREGKDLTFDMGEITCSDGKKLGFSIIAGAGYDAAIMEDARPAKQAFGMFAYYLAAGTNITPQVSKLKVTIDDTVVETEGLGVLLINFSKLQFDLSITHDNLPRDGKLEVAILKAKNAPELLPALFAAVLDKEGKNPNRSGALEVYRGATVRVEADPPLDIQFNGEVNGATTPFVARVIPYAVRIVLTDEAYELFS